MSYLLAIGHAALDRVVQVDVFPRADEKAQVTPLTHGGGGPAATAMVTVARMGGRGILCAALGQDAAGEDIRDELQSEGVDTEPMQMRAGCRSPLSYVVVEQQTASRTIFWDRGNAPRLRPDEIPAGLVEGAAALLVDGHQIQAQRAAAQRARQAGVPVVLDGGSLRPSTRELLELTDHAVVSERFARDWCGETGEKGLRALQAAGPAVAVITLGERGCIGTEGGETLAIPALPVSAMDTNGAGDVFHGAYLIGLERGFSLLQRLQLAAAAAGLACRTAGARPGIPGLEEALAAGVRIGRA